MHYQLEVMPIAGPMLHDVEAVLSVTAALTVIDGEGAVEGGT
jgi:hypothetical protein